MSIATKTGDEGETSLMYGRRVPKTDQRVDAYGCVDELNSALGLARASAKDLFLAEQILAVQKELVVVMGELATAPQDLNRYLKDGFHVTAAAMTDRLRERLAGSQLVFFDGTLWRDDEMIRLGVGSKTGRRMGHMSMSGDDGAIAAFRDLGVGRRIFVHINNSNPALLDDSPERHLANAAGWEIAYDGMEVTL